MAKKVSVEVAFIAEYEDGSKEQFSIDTFTISPKRSGDAIAGTIAREWQAGGRLKPGKIVRVCRAGT